MYVDTECFLGPSIVEVYAEDVFVTTDDAVIDVSGKDGDSGGQLVFAAAQIHGRVFLRANGGDGIAGTDGEEGKPGEDGTCEKPPTYASSTCATSGGDGGNGGTIVVRSSPSAGIAVHGGAGGRKGIGIEPHPDGQPWPTTCIEKIPLDCWHG